MPLNNTFHLAFVVFPLVLKKEKNISKYPIKFTFPLFKELYGMDSLPDRWEYCVKETDAAFGYGL
ncbi:unnamed protein product, partial [Rotaria sp. Silwood2]